MAAKISVKNLSVDFADRNIIKDVSFNIFPGENVAIMGASGSGKSVLIKSIIGLIEKNNGSIVIDDHDVTTEEVERITKRHNIGISFQHDALFDSMTILENLRFAILRKESLDKEESFARISDAMRQMDLHTDVLNHYPSEISGGMKKRIAIARALIVMPSIVFFDEPTSGLDPITSNSITDIMHLYIKNDDVTSIIVTHSISCAKTLTDKIIMLYDGKIKWHGNTNDIDYANDDYLQKFLHCERA